MKRIVVGSLAMVGAFLLGTLWGEPGMDRGIHAPRQVAPSRGVEERLQAIEALLRAQDQAGAGSRSVKERTAGSSEQVQEQAKARKPWKDRVQEWLAYVERRIAKGQRKMEFLKKHRASERRMRYQTGANSQWERMREGLLGIASEAAFQDYVKNRRSIDFDRAIEREDNE